jgi:hypothetical protein
MLCRARPGGVIRLAVASTSGWSDGDMRQVSGVLGTTEANGAWLVHVVDATHIDLTQGVPSGSPSVFTHAYVSGGKVGDPSWCAVALYQTGVGAGACTIGNNVCRDFMGAMQYQVKEFDPPALPNRIANNLGDAGQAGYIATAAGSSSLVWDTYWTSYSATVSASTPAGSGFATSVAMAQYKRNGQSADLRYQFTITNNGSGPAASGLLLFSVPSASGLGSVGTSGSASGSEVAVAGFIFGGNVSSNQVIIKKTDGSYAGSTGAQFVGIAEYSIV